VNCSFFGQDMSNMIEPLDDSHSSAPFAVILLPVAVALHIVEEWFGGFIDWLSLALDVNIEAERFLAINMIGLVLFAIGCASAYREPRAAWVGVSLAALVGVNAIAHTVLSVVVGGAILFGIGIHAAATLSATL
jgi:hypothetical protein